MNQKLLEIGQKLDISKEEIKSIQKEKRREKIKNKLLYPIAGSIAVILSIVGGHLAAKTFKSPSGGYPYSASVFPFLAVIQKLERRKLLALILTAIVSVVGFVVAYMLTQPQFSRAILYNVYRGNDEL